ncbi:ATP-binding cassette domain-containing protein [Kocuria soli]|uniref:ATP-binding cassette domain-containing protein n=1 Tax=Kocuria soli TaxID=2485125 RepID=A0A3N4ABA2_9MICC|nr:ATP-binding cassette domain-containing protein [Kocuria soli]ROZ63025.1 ATP-binding cassette domain-containing protein [Kocuria soli]
MIRRLLRVHDQLLPSEGKAWLVWAVLGSLVVALLDMVGIAAMMPLMLVATRAPGHESVLDRLAPFGVHGVGAGIVVLAAAVGGVFLLKTVAAIMFRWWLLGRTSRLEGLAAANMLERYAEAPYVVHRTRSNAQMNRQLDFSMSQVFGGLLNGYLMITVDALTLILATVVLAWISPVGTVAAVVVLGGVLAVIQLVLRSHQRRIGRELSDVAAEQWNARIPVVEGFRDVRLTTSVPFFTQQFRETRARQARAVRKLSILSEAPRYLLEVAMVVGIGAIAAAIQLMGDTGQMIAILGVFTAAAGRMLPTLNRLGANLGEARAATVGLEETESTLAALPAAVTTHHSPQDDGSGPAPLQGDIELQGVGFRFPDSRDWTLRGVNLRIPEGSTVALVGSSGAGKSTVLDVLLGLFAPTEGRVMCGGQDIAARPADWHRSLGVVSQDVFLINSSLRRNVAFGVPEGEIDDERLARALHSAQLDDLVADLPEGAETVLGERGIRISGGQRQRIGIARALYREPKVLILDEATSALDNLTEKKLSMTLEELAGRLTIVMVAHRLSTVRSADTIVFMDQGEVTDVGTFEEVRRSNEHFAQLVALGRVG